MSGQRKSLMLNMAWFSLLSLLAPVSIANVPMQLEIGMQKRHTVNQPIDRVVVGNPAVADVSVINAREILITPLAAGTTNLTIWPDKGKNVEDVCQDGNLCLLEEIRRLKKRNSEDSNEFCSLR